MAAVLLCQGEFLDITPASASTSTSQLHISTLIFLFYSAAFRMIIMANYAYVLSLSLLWCQILLHTQVCDAFQSPSLMSSTTSIHHPPNMNVLIPHRRSNHASRTKFYMMPETYDYMQQQLLLADGDVESWR